VIRLSPLARALLLLGVLPVSPAGAERLAVRRYTTADGLVHDNVAAISQDGRGFLWFGTAEGVSRFDGYRFTTLGGAHGLPNPLVTAIVEDGAGGRWVATRGGVVQFDASGRSRVHTLGDDPAANRIMTLYRDRNRRLWAGTQRGVFVLARPESAFVRVGRPVISSGDFWVSGFAEDRHGTVWISSNAGLMTWRSESGMDEQAGRRLGLGPADWGPLLADAKGRICGGGLAGLWCFLPSSPEATREGPRPPGVFLLDESAEPGWPHQPDQVFRYRLAAGGAYEVTALLCTRDGALWVATRGQGLLVLSEDTFRRYTTVERLVDDTLTSLYEDRDDNLWVGSPGGLMRLQRSGFVSYGPADGLVDAHVVSIVADQDGRPCALGREGVLQCVRGERLVSVRPRVPAPLARVGVNQLVALDPAGGWWVRARTGLYRFPDGDPLVALARAPRRFGKDAGLPVDHTSRVFVDSRGDLWLGVWDAGRNTIVRRAARTGAFEWIATPEGWGPRRVPMAFAEDGAGNVWIGFFEGGLARHRGGRLELVEGPQTRPGVVAHVRSLHVDAAGRLWFAASQAGLGRVDDPAGQRPVVKRYGRRDGLSSDYVGCVTEDQWGRIYAGTPRGVDRLEPASGLVRHFSADDGLAGGEVEDCTRVGDRLWFATAGGLSNFQPRLEPKGEPPPVYLQVLHLDGDPFELSLSGETQLAGLELPFPGRLHVEFASVGFGPGRGLRYQYRLHGVDRDWSPLTEERSVNYAGLNPGHYRFEVRAVSAEGLSSAAPASVAFHVVPPWWRRPWVVALATALLLAAVAALVRYRIVMLLRLERLRTRIASDLHDDVGSTVSRVAILSEVARRQVEGTNAAAAQALAEIGASARDLLDSTGDIVWAIDPRRDDGASLAARVREFGAGLLEAKGIAWEFSAAPEAEAARFDPEQRRQLLLIFKEALHNILRHADCSSAAVSIAVRDGRLQAEVRDDGRGFRGEPEKGQQGHGLSSMRTRAAQLGGELVIEAEPGAGTRVRLDVPLRRRGA
jgi:signal transduction histidine kinase/ligand-binding sensor domain-containing protein